MQCKAASSAPPIKKCQKAVPEKLCFCVVLPKHIVSVKFTVEFSKLLMFLSLWEDR